MPTSQPIPRRVDTADSVLSVVRRIAALFLILQVLADIALGATGYRSLPLAWALAGCTTAVLVYVVIRPRATTAVMFACAIPAVIQFANLSTVDGEIPFEAFQTWTRAAGWMILLSVPLRRARIGVTSVCVAIVVSVGCAGAVVGAALDWYALLVVSLATFASAMALAVGVDALFRSAQTDDVMQANQLAAERAAASACAQEEEANRTSWLLHDTVVNTLAAVASGTRAEPGQLAARCADDLVQLDRWLGEADESGATLTSAALWANVLVERARSLAVPLTVSGAEGVLHLSVEVSQAAIGALTEALNNISKHAPGAPAELLIVMDEAGFTATITDHGPGLRGGARRGMETSIAGRCRLANIAVDVSSRPGGGVAVKLAWRATTNIEQVDEVDFDLRSHVRDAVGTAMVWVLGLCLAPVLLADTWPEFMVRVLGWVAVAAVAVVLMQRWRSDQEPYRWTNAILVGIAFVSSFLYAWPFDGQVDPWPYTVGLLVLVLSVAVRQSLLLVAGVWFASAVGIVTANPNVVEQVVDRPGVLIAEFNLVALAVCGCTIVLLRRHAAASNSIYRDTRDALVRADAARTARQSRRMRAKAIADLVTPLMRDIAVQRADPIDQAVRKRAHTLACAARAATNVPTTNPQLEHLLLRAIAQLCEAQLDVQAGVMRADQSQIPPRVERQVDALITSAIEGCPIGSQVTLSVSLRQESGGFTVVIDLPASAALPAFPGYENESGQLIATVPIATVPLASSR